MENKNQDDLTCKETIQEHNNFTLIREWAIELHGEQMYGSEPYSYHLDEVLMLALEFQLKDYVIPSLLHDVIEDCGVTRELIEKRTSKEVADMVWAVSGFGANRKERKDDILIKLNEYPKAINLKMLDRLANMRNSEKNNPKLLAMYMNELDDYMPLFKLGNNKLFKEFEIFQEKYPKTSKKTKIKP